MKYLKTFLFASLFACVLTGCEEDYGPETITPETDLKTDLISYIKELKNNGETNLTPKIKSFLGKHYDVSEIMPPVATNSIQPPDQYCEVTTTFIIDRNTNERWQINEYKQCGNKTNCVQGFIYSGGIYIQAYLIC